MAYFDGYTREEMASILKEPVGTIKTRLRDAILRLSAVFKDPEAILQSAKDFPGRRSLYEMPMLNH